jgi:hypothetical protein
VEDLFKNLFVTRGGQCRCHAPQLPPATLGKNMQPQSMDPRGSCTSSNQIGRRISMRLLSVGGCPVERFTSWVTIVLAAMLLECGWVLCIGFKARCFLGIKHHSVCQYAQTPFSCRLEVFTCRHCFQAASQLFFRFKSPRKLLSKSD